MALEYNGKNVQSAEYNGKPVSAIYYNGNIVFSGATKQYIDNNISISIRVEKDPADHNLYICKCSLSWFAKGDNYKHSKAARVALTKNGRTSWVELPVENKTKVEGGLTYPVSEGNKVSVKVYYNDPAKGYKEYNTSSVDDVVDLSAGVVKLYYNISIRKISDTEAEYKIAYLPGSFGTGAIYTLGGVGDVDGRVIVPLYLSSSQSPFISTVSPAELYGSKEVLLYGLNDDGTTTIVYSGPFKDVPEIPITKTFERTFNS